MDHLPPQLLAILQAFRPLMRSEVFASFCYLLAGLLIGEAKAGTVRASVFAPADYWPQRLSDLFCHHKLSGQALMARLVGVALSHLASVDWFPRLKYVAGRAKNLKGHCYVFAAHLYTHGEGKVRQWASVLVGAVLDIKGRSIPTLVGALAQH